jgi:hypothetical protein
MRGTTLLFSLIALAIGFGAGWMGSQANLERAPNPAQLDAAELALELQSAFSEASVTERLLRLDGVLASLDPSTLESALVVVERERSVLRDLEVELFYEAWARFDPVSAIEYAGNWPRSKRAIATGAALKEWAREDPEAALRGVAELIEADPSRATQLNRHLVAGWVYSSDPDSSFEYVVGLNETVRSQSGLALVANQVRRLGPTGLSQWADERLPEAGAFQKNFFRRVMRALVRRDPSLASDWALRHGDQDYAGDGVRLLMETWLPQSPDIALQWLSTHVPESSRQIALESASRSWVLKDFQGAGRWLDAQPPNSLHDPILAAYTRGLSRQKNDAAVDWAERISDDTLRGRTLQLAATQWYQRDPEGAEVWLLSSSLDEPARQAVREAPVARPGTGAQRRKSRQTERREGLEADSGAPQSPMSPGGA